jgi:ABC-type Fe3+-hydroxamate transport system substrate-binding protein
MAAHKKSLTVVIVSALLVLFLREPAAQAPAAPQRIVSLIPAVTEMLFAIGAGPRVIGVGNFDRYPPEAQTRTKVGGLIDPDIERVISLKPDLLVFGRDAETLRGIYASGAVGFLHGMLDAAGGANVFADVTRQSIQATTELILARAPDVIIEIGIDTASSKSRSLRAWDALGSVPAVRAHRIYQIRGDEMMNPGPRVARAVRRMAEALHPDAFK